MNKQYKKFLLLLILSLFVFINVSFAQSNSKEIDKLLETYREYGQFNGTVLVAKDGKVIHQKGYGMANMEWDIPNHPDTKFRIGSVTKQFTATLILQLVSEGKIRLDGKITDYLPDYRKDTGDKITIHQLLNHTSGIPSYTALPGFFANDSRDPYSVADFIKKFASGDLEFEPGTKFQYSGEGFEYLRKALEHKFSRSLDDIARQELFQPLGMHDTHFFWSDQVDENRYAVESDPDGHPLPFEKYDAPNAAANLLTTVEDYAKFLVCILDGGGLSPQLFALFSSPISTVKDGINWGLGMQVFPNLPGDEYALVHTGGDNGTKCIAMVLPRSRQGLVLFINSENGLKIWKKIIEEYFGETGAEIVRRNLEG